MKAILGSKLYRTSARQDKILSKLSDPINTELVTQLREYLDDEYLTPKYFPKEDKLEPVEVEDVDNSNEEPTPTRAPQPASFSAPSFPGEFFEDDEDIEETSPDEDTDIQEELTDEMTDEENVEDVDVEESVAITSVDETPDIRSTEDVQQFLNDIPDTSGVIRTKQRNNEFWIYYDDSINLNNVMSKVIDVLSIPEFRYLDFNRLARTDNAIVFEMHDR